MPALWATTLLLAPRSAVLVLRAPMPMRLEQLCARFARLALTLPCLVLLLQVLVLSAAEGHTLT